MIVFTGQTKELWILIRILIFKTILTRNTLPREAASLFKCGFYDIIVRPILKLINTIDEYHKEPEYLAFLRHTAIKALTVMKEIEENHSTIINYAIESATNTNNQFPSLEQWDKYICESISVRLWEDGYSDMIKAEILKIKYPCLIFVLSNAPIHMAIEHSRNYYKAITNNDEVLKTKSINSIKDILIRHSSIINMIQEKIYPNVPDYIDRNNTKSAAEYYMIKQIQIETIAEKTQLKIKPFIEAKIEEAQVLTSEEEITQFIADRMKEIAANLRERVLCNNRQYDEDLELCIEAINKSQSRQTANKTKNQPEAKRKPGRPPNEPKTDNTQIKITDFIKPKKPQK